MILVGFSRGTEYRNFRVNLLVRFELGRGEKKGGSTILISIGRMGRPAVTTADTLAEGCCVTGGYTARQTRGPSSDRERDLFCVVYKWSAF